ncbi:MAG: FtsW/RodA/SpoVE family cell cycle protein [Bacteroidales bacterium]|nr:FtsW/RodA/SpoVE family cell cycle protein [Bacteroidales bacterium]
MKNNIFSIFKGDRWIWSCYIVLLGASLMFIHSTTGALEFQRHSTPVHYLINQCIFIILAVFAVLIMSNISYKRLFNLANIALIIAIALLLITLICGDATNDAKRWLKIPIIDQTIQTSDIAKLCLTIFIAKTMASHQQNHEDIKRGAIYSGLAMAVVSGLILPANLSTALLVGVTSVLLLVITRVMVKHILIVGSGLAVIAFLAVLALGKTGALPRAETWVNRIEAYVQSDDSKDKKDNFQADQAKIAISRGGLIGQGSGASMQKNVLPHPYSDFIFASIIEERGLIAGLVVIALYIILMHRSVIAAKYQSRAFPAFLCIGLALNIVLQAVSNMVVAVNLVPVTGQPLPMISMGGTSLIISSISVGIILNISRYSEQEGKEKEKEEVEESDREQNIEDITDYPFVIG